MEQDPQVGKEEGTDQVAAGEITLVMARVFFVKIE